MPKGIYSRKKLNEMQELNGRLPGKVPATLDDIMGFQKTSRYTQRSIEEYKNYLNTLNSTDLQRHAQSVGIRPVHETYHLKRGLIAEFSRYSREVLNRPASSKIESGDVSDEVREILNRGR